MFLASCTPRIYCPLVDEDTMGVYNFLVTSLQCPHCGAISDGSVHLSFGIHTRNDYHIGDVYQWCANEAVARGGRPADGNLDGDGFVICGSCERFFALTIVIRSDVIQGIRDIRTQLPWEATTSTL
jgi:hypothetical protein